jgi:hypothetical protein
MNERRLNARFNSPQPPNPGPTKPGIQTPLIVRADRPQRIDVPPDNPFAGSTIAHY